MNAFIALSEKWGQNLTFKGGTSLSKGWEMFFGKVPDFEKIIRIIGDFEDSFNSLNPCGD